MSTIADTAIRSIVGLAVVTAMFLTIWVAKDSSARTRAPAFDGEAASAALYSARNDRAPVTRTAITPAQLRALRASSTDDPAASGEQR